MSAPRSLLLGLVAAVGLAAQEPLTLEAAARMALRSHPAIDAAEARSGQAAEGVRVAKAGLLPRLSWQESYTRSNNPVYAFGTLLSQKRFTESNFAVTRLNNPGSVQNFQSVVSLEQTLFDANRTKHAVRAARLQEELSAEARRARELDVLLGVVRTYFGVVLAGEQAAVADQAVKSADADLRRAQAMHEAGQTTMADVLAVQVHRSEALEQKIRAANDAEVARAALNDAIGLPLDAPHEPSTPLVAAQPPETTLAELTKLAAEARPEVKQAALGVDLSAAQTKQAETARWPTIVAQGAFEADRARFVDQGGGNWLAGVSMRWDLWKGSENRAQVEAARFAEERAAAERREVQSASALRVRRAWFGFRSAEERLSVAESAVEMAEESLRIVRNRYDSGLDTVTELLRSETAVTDARFRRLGALYEQRTARAELDYAAGRLNVDSEVLR